MSESNRRNSFQSVWMDGSKDKPVPQSQNDRTEAEQFEFDAFLQERETASQLFHEKPQETRYPALTGVSTQAASTGGSEARSTKPATGDAGALEGWRNVPVVVPIVAWITLSSAVILMNKWILDDLGFGYPIALTTFHLLFQTVSSRLLYRYTNLVDGAKALESSGKMNREVFARNIVPIGLLFSVSLVLSNWVYLRLSVSFIQMIKAITPVVVLGVSVLFKVKTASGKLVAIVGLISLGVGVASYGEVKFDALGFSVQLFAILVESCRLVLVQILLQGMDPITSLYYFAPVCLATNSLALVFTEGLKPLSDIHLVGVPTLLFNAACTLLLNLSSVWLIGRASGLVLTLSGVVKDILLIAGSFLLLGSFITGTQIIGYALALTGLVLFKTQG